MVRGTKVGRRSRRITSVANETLQVMIEEDKDNDHSVSEDGSGTCTYREA